MIRNEQVHLARPGEHTRRLMKLVPTIADCSQSRIANFTGNEETEGEEREEKKRENTKKNRGFFWVQKSSNFSWACFVFGKRKSRTRPPREDIAIIVEYRTTPVLIQKPNN